MTPLPEHLGVWFIASIIKHFKTLITRVPIFIDGEESDKSCSRVQLRIDGPIIKPLSHNCFKARLFIEFSLINLIDAKSVYTYPTLKGHIASAFTNSICCYRLSEEHNGTYFASLGIITDVDINDYGQLNPDERILYSTISSDYEVQLTGDEVNS